MAHRRVWSWTGPARGSARRNRSSSGGMRSRGSSRRSRRRRPVTARSSWSREPPGSARRRSWVRRAVTRRSAGCASSRRVGPQPLERDFSFGVVRQLFDPVFAEVDEHERANLLLGDAGAVAGLLGLLGAPPPFSVGTRRSVVRDPARSLLAVRESCRRDAAVPRRRRRTLGRRRRRFGSWRSS